MRNKYLVALSGGVDSAVTAALLLRDGHAVSGVTMDTGIGSVPQEASLIAKELGINHYVIDLKELFKATVITDFLNSYYSGETPNPCVVCNKTIKFAAFFPLLDQLGYDYLATGHYVRQGYEKGRYLLYKGKYLPKDQSYFLYSLSQDALAKVAFPLGSYTKTKIRSLAQEFGLKVAEKKESQDICFIPNGDYRKFIEENTTKHPKSGVMVDREGNILCSHQGLAYYTIGQRKGLGLALGYPAYVVAMDKDKNQIKIGREQDLYTNCAITRENNFLPFDKLKDSLEVSVKIRYKSDPVPAIIKAEKEKIKIIFKNPVRAITPGQSAVFYQDDLLVGGGIIENIF